MTKSQTYSTSLILAIWLLSSACVSVDIAPKNKLTKADQVTYTAPPQPFARMDNTFSDAAWENPINGNSISFLSDCGEGADTPLKSQFQAMTRGIQELKIESTESLIYNGRAALRHTFSGLVDGIHMQISSLHFKRNDCSYVLTYVSTVTNFNKDLLTFNQFLTGFKAP